jgi:hypothetical protein
MSVYWLLTAEERFRAELNQASDDVGGWLTRLNSVLTETFAGQVVLVRDRYSGYRPFDGLVVLFVDVQRGESVRQCNFASPGTYIVKIAFDERQASLRDEIAAWNSTSPVSSTATACSCN